jgi:7-cyano-7-deazaguanine reductase
MSRPADSAASCRHLLATAPAPLTSLVAVTSFAATLCAGTTLTVQYVPDRLVLTRAGFEAYAAAQREQPATTPEALAAVVADDVANELVPKWLRVTVAVAGAVSHSVTVEDRQPGWDHPSLLKDV